MELDKLETGESIRKLIALREEIVDLGHSLEDRQDRGRPPVDLRDLGDAFELVVEVPGVTQRDLEVALDGRKLIVAGQRPKDDGASLLLSERPEGSFRRTVELPQAIDREASRAHLQSGLLIVHLPKA